MRHLIFLFLFIFLSHSLHAHEVNEAFFVVKKQGNRIIVESEFPWTFRNALIAFNPKLENTTDKQEFENTFIQYIKENLILVDSDGITLPFKGFKEIDKSGHSHQNNYVLTYEGNSVAEITNTVMFNIHDNQINYTTVQSNKGQNTFKIKKGNSTIKVIEEKNSIRIGYLALIILSAVIVFVLIKNNYGK